MGSLPIAGESECRKPAVERGPLFSQLGTVAHASYDRIFQTPSFENILLSSSSAVTSLNPLVLRLPVLPSHGNYYEVGLTKDFFGLLRFDANVFDRRVKNYADDDQLLSTAVSFPSPSTRLTSMARKGNWKSRSGNISTVM